MSLQCVVTKADEQSRFRTAVNWSVRDGDKVIARGVSYGIGDEHARARGHRAARSAAGRHVRTAQRREYEAQRQYWYERYKVSGEKAFFSESSNCWLSEVEVRRPNNSTVSAFSVEGPFEVLQQFGRGDSPEEAQRRAVDLGTRWVERDLSAWMRRVEAHRKAGIPV